MVSLRKKTPHFGTFSFKSVQKKGKYIKMNVDISANNLVLEEFDEKC